MENFTMGTFKGHIHFSYFEHVNTERQLRGCAANIIGFSRVCVCSQATDTGCRPEKASQTTQGIHIICCVSDDPDVDIKPALI